MTANPNVKMDNFGIMDLIIDEYKKFKQNNTSFRGLKVIYCTPRVSKSDKRESVEDCVNHIEKSLAECLAMKKHTKYGPYVAGKLMLYSPVLFNLVSIIVSYIT